MLGRGAYQSVNAGKVRLVRWVWLRYSTKAYIGRVRLRSSDDTRPRPSLQVLEGLALDDIHSFAQRDASF